jgi:hypothetical protein
MAKKKPVAKKKRVTNLFDSFLPTSEDALRAARGTASGTRKRRRARSKGQSTTSALTPVASREKQPAESGWRQLGEKPHDGPIWRCRTGHRHRGTRPDGSPCTYKKKDWKKANKAKKAKKGERKHPNTAALMRTTTPRAQPARITGVVRGGLPGLGKRR